jgi:starch phosphorylase
MTAFALRLSGFRNAVSKRHAQVSKEMWRSLWPDVPIDQVPIDYVTNGVHVPTWIEPKLKRCLVFVSRTSKNIGIVPDAHSTLTPKKV